MPVSGYLWKTPAIYRISVFLELTAAATSPDTTDVSALAVLALFITVLAPAPFVVGEHNAQRRDGFTLLRHDGPYLAPGGNHCPNPDSQDQELEGEGNPEGV